MVRTPLAAFFNIPKMKKRKVCPRPQGRRQTDNCGFDGREEENLPTNN